MAHEQSYAQSVKNLSICGLLVTGLAVKCDGFKSHQVYTFFAYYYRPQQ